MKSINVIVPSWHYWHDPIRLQPLWEMYYATLMAERFPKLHVELTDLRCRPPADALSIAQSDVYFYWIMKSGDAEEVYGIVKHLRKVYPESVHIAGGAHVDNCTEQCLKEFDACVLGTAEELVVQAIQDLDQNRLQNLYKSSGVYPFKNYSFARRDFLPVDRIVNTKHFERYGGALGTGAFFSRGCSFSCNFCVYNNPSKFQLRTLQQIDDEILYLKKNYKIQAINLRDEVCLPVNKEEALAQLEVIGKHNILWRGQTVPFGPEEVVAKARQSGCVELSIGMETVESDAMLKAINKPYQSVERGRQYVELLKKYGIKVKVCLIFGLPGESREVLKKTINFLESVQPDYVALSGFDPVPGSFFYDKKERYGIRMLTEDLSQHAHLLYRFGDDEEVGLPFEYEACEYSPNPLSRGEIIQNIRELQSYLRANNMCY